MNLLFFLLGIAFLPLLVSGNISLGTPSVLVDGRVIRIDVLKTSKNVFASNPEYLRILKGEACTAIDMPFLPYDPKDPEHTGCHSPGYKAITIYQWDRHIVSPFKARLLRPLVPSLYMDRLLIDARAPIVYVQMEVLVAKTTNALRKGAGVKQVLHTHYIMEESSRGIDPKNSDDDGSPNETKRQSLPMHVLMIPVGVALILVSIVLVVVTRVKRHPRVVYSGYGQRRDAERDEAIRDALMTSTELGMYEVGGKNSGESAFLDKRE